MYAGNEMRYKVTEFSGVDNQGTPLVTAINPRNVVDGWLLEKTAFHLAYTEEVQAFIDQLQPTEGKLYVLINALGAGEYYGPNLNWDYFPESEILRGDGYGYETYMDCGVYRNHKNARHGGISFGRVVLAVYNKVMHRVELILEIDRRKADELGHGDLVEALDRNEHPHVSMGMLVPFDECIVPSCRCKAPTKYDRCEHMRKPLLGNIGPGGVQCCLVNRYFKHHDISFVVIPASSIGVTVEKLASFGAQAERHTRIAEISDNLTPKLASILKTVPAIASKIPNQHPPIPFSSLRSACSDSAAGALSGSLSTGVMLRPLEFQTISLIGSGKDRLADELYRKQVTFGPCSHCSTRLGFSDVPSPPSAIAALSDSARYRGIQERNVLERAPDVAARYTVTIKRAPLLDSISPAYNAYLLEFLQKIRRSLLRGAIAGRMVGRYEEKLASAAIGPHSIAAIYANITEHGGDGFDAYGEFGSSLASELIGLAESAFAFDPWPWETPLPY